MNAIFDPSGDQAIESLCPDGPHARSSFFPDETRSTVGLWSEKSDPSPSEKASSLPSGDHEGENASRAISRSPLPLRWMMKTAGRELRAES
jgi:hypothetical protein